MYEQFYPYMKPNYMQTQGIQYVNGIESANAFNVAPNQQVMLMDSNKSIFYVKTADASGFSTVKAYEFKEYQEPEKEQTDFVKKTEFEELKTQLNNLSTKLENSLKSAYKGSKGITNNESN